jgi:queuosine precursor transporter
MLDIRQTAPFVAAMALVVIASNYLVQFPLQLTLGSVDLADLLTWGAFTYPLAFLVTDLTNRRFGVRAARGVVLAGFVIAVALSIWLATPRIAIASGSAFLLAQLLDVSIFDTLRRAAWWKAPLISTVIGSVVDTVLFFTLAFAATFAFLGANDDFAIGTAPLFGVFAVEAPRWVSWALGDLAVKLLALLSVIRPKHTATL